MSSTHPCFLPAPYGRLRHSRGEQLTRHCHAQPYAAIVLSGGYQEAGDRGRHKVVAGDVLIHSAFESHLNRFGAMGAEVLLIPAPVTNSAVLARLSDPDRLARVAEHDPLEAAALLAEELRPAPLAQQDWPDLLAALLRDKPNLSLADWARSMNLRPETVSRGFKAAYGVTPAGYRGTARARAAFESIRRKQLSLAEIASDIGFADQAHMTRAVAQLTGHAPGHWRRL